MSANQTSGPKAGLPVMESMVSHMAPLLVGILCIAG